MFVGHYGVSFAAKKVAPDIPLWVLFIAVQLLDVAWAPLVLLGVEKVRIVPGITAVGPASLRFRPARCWNRLRWNRGAREASPDRIPNSFRSAAMTFA